MTEYRLLAEFRKLFKGKKYIHRASNLGDFVAMHFYEDLVAVNRSSKLVQAVEAGERVLNVQNKRKGIEARRGDGTFGEIIPGETPIRDPCVWGSRDHSAAIAEFTAEHAECAENVEKTQRAAAATER